MRVAAAVATCAAIGLAAVTVADNVGGGRVWSYEGPTGPENWGSLNPAFSLCRTGSQQSPIDVSAQVPASVAPPVVDWRPTTPEAIVNTGDTIVVRTRDAGGVVLGDTPYSLTQVDFHHSSEHTIDGRRYPMEVHFVHRSAAGDQAVIAVMVEAGRRHETIAAIWSAAPPQPGASESRFPLLLTSLLPEDRRAFYYAGSLTTPPCTENVTWAVMATPIEISRAQLDAFATAFPANARPLQPRNRRFVLTGL